MKILYVFFILLSLIILLSIIFFTSNIHKKDKFKSYIKFLGGIVIIFTVLSISLQAQSSKEKTAMDSIIFFKNLTKELLDDTFTPFNISNADFHGIQKIKKYNGEFHALPYLSS